MFGINHHFHIDEHNRLTFDWEDQTGLSIHVEGQVPSTLALSDFEYYKRTEDGIDFKKQKEIQRIKEMARIEDNYFAGTMPINGGETEPAQVLWQAFRWDEASVNRNSEGYAYPKGYKVRPGNFYDRVFYVNAPNSDQLNGKI